MEIQLISGTFTMAEAEQLLTSIFKTKIAFHEKRIGKLDEHEEDMKHSEKRILKLEETLRSAIRSMKETGQAHARINANIEVDTFSN